MRTHVQERNTLAHQQFYLRQALESWRVDSKALACGGQQGVMMVQL
jgi:hypothetical protein